MSDDVVRDILATAGTEMRIVRVSDPPLFYGVDLVCIDELTDDLQETDPTSAASLAQDVFHRLNTQRGTLPDDPDYGYDLAGALNRGVTAQEIAGIQGNARQEILKDDRLTEAVVIVAAAQTADGNTYHVHITLTPAASNQTFSLIVAVTDGVALLTAIQGNGA